MASFSLASTLNFSPFRLKFPSSRLVSFTHGVRLSPISSKTFFEKKDLNLTVKAQARELSSSIFEDEDELDDDLPPVRGSSFFEGEFGSEDDLPSFGWANIPPIEDKEPPQCPPGFRQYETMTILRPDMSEEERLALTQKYEELLVAGGGMYVEVFNRGVIPLAYSIKKKNREGETNTYMDGIYLLFTYVTKPESMGVLEETLRADDNVIRSTSLKKRKRKY